MPASPPARDRHRTYVVVQDLTARSRRRATVTLTWTTACSRPAAGGEELTDTGTYSIRDGRMTELIERNFATDRCTASTATLEIPLKMFGEGAGSSTWKRTDGQAAVKSPPPREH
jgi:hypothetical protein